MAHGLMTDQKGGVVRRLAACATELEAALWKRRFVAESLNTIVSFKETGFQLWIGSWREGLTADPSLVVVGL